MVYAEFQKHSTGWNGTDFSGPVEIIPMLGSDGVYIMDGRHNLASMFAAARRRANEIQHLHGNCIIGFKLHRGRSFTDSQPITGVIAL